MQIVHGKATGSNCTTATQTNKVQYKGARLMLTQRLFWAVIVGPHHTALGQCDEGELFRTTLPLLGHD